MSIFSKIIARELPASIVYEDDRCIAFMDINPMSPGHTLVCPKLERATLAELDTELRSHLWEIAQHIAEAQRESLGSLAQHFLVNDGKAASQSVPHVHIHVMPRYRRDALITGMRMLAHVATLAIPLPVSQSKRRRLDEQAQKISDALKTPT